MPRLLTRLLTLPRIAPLQVVPFIAAFAQTTKQQLASQGALALNATAGLLQGDTAPATAFEQATAMIIKMQASPIPTALTIRRDRGAAAFVCSWSQQLTRASRSFDIFIRAQLQVNGGDSACPPHGMRECAALTSSCAPAAVATVL